jgi:predicted O-methyltransferase YrrM
LIKKVESFKQWLLSNNKILVKIVNIDDGIAIVEKK